MSQLKRVVGSYQHSLDLPPDLGMDNKDMIQPEKVLSWRDSFEEGLHTREWLIQWKGMAPEDATWEKKLLLQTQFPEFILKDRDAFDAGGGGSDRIGRRKERGVLLSWQLVSSSVGNMCGLETRNRNGYAFSVRQRETFSLF